MRPILSLLALPAALGRCSSGGAGGCRPPRGEKWQHWDMAHSTYVYCYQRTKGRGCPVDWFAEQVASGAAPELAAYAGVVGADHYWTHQGMPCVDGKPREFRAQAELASRFKASFPSLRFMTYRILDAVPYDMVVRRKMLADPGAFVRWLHLPDSSSPGNGSICFNNVDACFNSPKGINDPANRCSFKIQSAAYDFKSPEVRKWYLETIIAGALQHADGIWLDGNGPDNGAYMCSGVCCGFGPENSPHNAAEIDAYCAGEAAVARAAHEYLHAQGSYEMMSCTTYLRADRVPTARDAPEQCARKLRAAAELGADHSKYNMVVAYGDRNSETAGSYDDASAAGAVAAFLLARGEHWLMAMEPLARMNVTTARLLTSDYGRPLGNMTAVQGRAHVFRREYERAAVELDCGSFAGSFREHGAAAELLFQA